MRNGIMLDIETLGTTAGCVVLSIGAAEFKGDTIVKDFQVNIDVQDSVDNGCTIDPKTFLWWMGQNKEAQQSLLDRGVVTLSAGLELLVEAFDWEKKPVWCNGASFDFPILNDVFTKTGVTRPWQYYDEMDYRTIKGLMTKEEFKQLRVDAKTAHDSLADARAQIATLGNMLKRLDLGWQ